MVVIDVAELLRRIECGEQSKIQDDWNCAVVIDGDNKVCEFEESVRRACEKSGSTFHTFINNSISSSVEIKSIIINAKDIMKRIAINIYDIGRWYTEFNKYPYYYQQNHFREIAMYDVDYSWCEGLRFWAVDQYGATDTFAVSMRFFIDNIYPLVIRNNELRDDGADKLDAFFEEF